MNQIVIIGNGFDLAHGLPTRYSDFMLAYLKDCIVEADKNVGETLTFGPITVRCRAHLQDNVHNILEDINSIVEMSSSSWIELDIQSPGSSIYFIESSPVNERQNKLYKFQIKSDLINDLLLKQADVNWIDIETEYFKLLNQALDNEHIEDQKDLIRKLNEDLNFLKVELCKYLNKTQANEDLFRGLNSEFMNRMENFLFPKLSSKSGTLTGPYKRLIVNYNYTSTVEGYLRDATENFITKISYIHGSLSNQTSDIVFGFGSVDGPELSRILSSGIPEAGENLKFMIYPLSGQDNDLNKILKAGPFEVRVVGHSCGLSDGSTLRQIFEHKNCENISVCYRNRTDFSERIYNIYGQLKELKRLPIETMDIDLCFENEASNSSDIKDL